MLKDSFIINVILLIVTAASPEPSCQELRDMWNFSKRQSGSAEYTNEIPMYRDPFAYNTWDGNPTFRSAGGGKIRRPLVYGRLVPAFQRPRQVAQAKPEYIRAFEELFGTSVQVPYKHSRYMAPAARLVGGNNQLHAHSGSFQHLKDLIQTERARELHDQKESEESVMHLMNQDQNMFHQDYKQTSRGRDRLVNFRS